MLIILVNRVSARKLFKKDGWILESCSSYVFKVLGRYFLYKVPFYSIVDNTGNIDNLEIVIQPHLAEDSFGAYGRVVLALSVCLSLLPETSFSKLLCLFGLENKLFKWFQSDHHAHTVYVENS